jgi:hypothetical protein
MSDAMNSKVCGRAEDLISFLYGELDEREARDFQQHRKDCPNCQAELDSFGSVRQSLLAWRDQSLGFAAGASSMVGETASLKRQRKGSAWAAIQSFFDLSPFWLKGATAFAVVFFCVLSGLVVFRSLGKSEVQPNIVKQNYSPEQLEAEVQRRVALKIAAMKNSDEATTSTATVVNDPNPRRQSVVRAKPMPRNVAVANPLPQKTRKPLTRAEREQLAADLRLISDDDEDSLQLLGDRINREE